MKFRAQKIKGKIDINWRHLEIYTSKWKDGARFTIEIIREQKRRSDPMRKYYFAAVIKPFMEYLGYEPDELELFHRQLKIVYFQIGKDNKGIYRNVPHVFADESELPVPEKKKFVDWVVRKAAAEGVYIEDPKS
jgi:hypothetical protein